MPTTKEAAEQLGCNRKTITRAAKRYGIGKRLGPLLVFTVSEVARLRDCIREAPGNPQFSDHKKTKKQKTAKSAKQAK